ncbi:MAG: hypothetical protein JSV64_01375 [Candidatus Bathyarchaeota archaeon]|nr:MAG: hypothetical protein JSV64_01375 [Candidatus Bathyarchaeota archaeon]
MTIGFLVYYLESTCKSERRINIDKQGRPREASGAFTEREIVVREIVILPCQYCGGLIPQTSVFCPNCGATRKTRQELYKRAL